MSDCAPHVPIGCWVLDVGCSPKAPLDSPLASLPEVRYTLRRMKFLRAATAAVATLLWLTGCIQVEKVVKLKPDGTGTIEETLLIPKAALATMQQMTGGGGKPLELFDEVRLKQAASQMGDGVSYVSGKKLATEAGEGFSVTYAFTDINKLKLDQNLIEALPGPPGGSEPRQKPEPVVFHFTKGSPAELRVAMPAPEFKSKAPQSDSADDTAMKMMEQMLKDMKMTFAVEMDGTISETNAAYREGSRVTLMEMDFNKVLADPEKFKALARANPQTMQEARALLKGIDGVKIETSPEVKIKFQ